MKRLLLSAVILSSMGAYAQVGVNTTDPKASLEVAYDTSQGKKVQAIGLPQMTTQQRNNFKYGDLKNGQMIYNTSQNCVEVFINKEWKCLSSTAGAEPQPIDPNIPPVPENEVNLGRNASVATIGDATTYVASLTYQGMSYQGVIDNNNNKITLKIPYTGGNGQSYAGVTATTQSEVGAMQGKPRVRKPIKMKVLPGRLSGNGFITAEITTDELFNVKMLPPDGNTVKKVAEFELKIGNKTQTVIVNAIGGIPDKKYNDLTDGEYLHKFIYLPVRVTGTVDGESYDETWLNFNLGADYANMNKKDEGIFNPAKVVTFKTDHHAYGSLFQFGRDSDGHELVNWENYNTGSRAKDVTWYTDSQLSYSKANDPCPNGYRTPKKEDWVKFHKLITGTDSSSYTSKMWDERKLSLPAAGFSGYSNGIVYRSTSYHGYYWSSSSADKGDVYASNLDINRYGTLPEDTSSRSLGMSVRCLKDK